MKTDSLIDIKELEESLGLDAETIQILLDSLKEDAAIDLNHLLVAINSNDYTQIKEYAHKLKGACANLRIKVAAELAFAIEQNAKNCEPYFEYLTTYTKLKEIIEDAHI